MRNRISVKRTRTVWFLHPFQLLRGDRTVWFHDDATEIGMMECLISCPTFFWIEFEKFLEQIGFFRREEVSVRESWLNVVLHVTSGMCWKVRERNSDNQIKG